MLRVKGISHGYQGGPDILVDLNLEVFEGERLAVMGPSGSGKSTLLAILGGLARPRRGSVSSRRGEGGIPSVAWVLQTVNVLSDRSVIDNVAVGALGGGCRWREALSVARRELHRVGLGDRESVAVRVLSGGEAQRVVIARALASSAELILADEPTGQLDARTTDEVLDILLGAHGRTIVVVTHDVSVAARCDRTLHLVDGQLVP